MQHRVFIAINLPDDIKRKLQGYKAKWPELPCRWTKRENLHITLIFLGSLSDEDVLEVCKTAKETASRHSPFFINLEKIIYGPPKKFPPRMVWVEGEKSEELGALQSELENSLLTTSSKGLNSDVKPYASHITLGRIKTWELRRIEEEERPDVNEEINLSFPVNSIEVMESKLKREGPEYAILESCQLQN